MAASEYRKAKTAMVTKNSAEEEKSPIKESFSRRLPSQVGASKFTWCNLENIPKSGRWSTEKGNCYPNNDINTFALSPCLIPDVHWSPSWITGPISSFVGCALQRCSHTRLYPHEHLGENDDLYTSFNQPQRKVDVAMVWYNLLLWLHVLSQVLPWQQLKKDEKLFDSWVLTVKAAENRFYALYSGHGIPVFGSSQLPDSYLWLLAHGAVSHIVSLH